MDQVLLKSENRKIDTPIEGRPNVNWEIVLRDFLFDILGRSSFNSQAKANTL
jgi:hypothetical protein